jgi:hypothetical protein
MLFDQAGCDDSTLYGELYRNGTPIFCTEPRPGGEYALYTFVAAGPLAQRITHIGSGRALGTTIAGGIAELAVYDRDLGAAELNAVGSALAAKWGLEWKPVLAVLANTVRDFSGVQGWANWRYGCWEKENTGPSYEAGTEFVEFSAAYWSWVEWVSKLGGHNSSFCGYAYYHKIGRAWSHPSADNPGAAGWTQTEAWPIRRWVCPVNGGATIEGIYAATLDAGLGGNGTRVVIFHNGEEVFAAQRTPGQTYPVAYTVGAQRPLRVQAGDVLDFALDPIADDMNSDATRFTATIRFVPPPTGAVLILR